MFITFSSAETVPEVVETPTEDATEKETPEVVEVEEATNGHANGNGTKNGEAKNGDSENGHANGKEKNGEATEEAKNGEAEETNGEAATEDKEATKRKAEDDPIEEIPVSAEKIAKLKESEVIPEVTEEEATA